MDFGGQVTAIYTLGWFYEFKLHLIIPDNGDILNFMFITGAVMIRYAKYVGATELGTTWHKLGFHWLRSKNQNTPKLLSANYYTPNASI